MAGLITEMQMYEKCTKLSLCRNVTDITVTMQCISTPYIISVLLLQAADSRGARGRATAGQPDPHAAAAGGLPEDHQPASYPRPAVPAEQLSVRTTKPAALD